MDMSDLNDVSSPQTIETMTAIAEGRSASTGPRQRELATAALAAGEGTLAWLEAESALAELAH